MGLTALIIEANPALSQLLTRAVEQSAALAAPSLHPAPAQPLRLLKAGSMGEVLSWPSLPPVDLMLLEVTQAVPNGHTSRQPDGALHGATTVVMADSFEDEQVLRALAAGADSVVVKNQPFESLVQVLRYVWSGHVVWHMRLARKVLQALRKPSESEAPVWDCERLTPRETEVLTYMSKGFTIREIASLMSIRWFTVNDHIKSIYRKLNVSSRAEAAALATKHGLV